MIVPQRTATLILILAILVAIVFVIASSKNVVEVAPDIQNPIAINRAKILAIVSTASPLTLAERRMIFFSLSEHKISQYNFTEFEKLLIVNALNNHKESGQKSSSAREDFSRKQLSTLSL